MASIKAVELCNLLLELGEVRLVATRPARHFIKDSELPAAVLPVLGVRGRDRREIDSCWLCLLRALWAGIGLFINTCAQ
mgnify:CR=1 FL=1